MLTPLNVCDLTFDKCTHAFYKRRWTNIHNTGEVYSYNDEKSTFCDVNVVVQPKKTYTQLKAEVTGVASKKKG